MCVFHVEVCWCVCLCVRVCVCVCVSCRFTSNDLIGFYQFDLTNVYAQEGHEVHRQWVGLMDDQSVKDHGVQGFLQCSVVVLGPGDKQRAHDGLDADFATDPVSDELSDLKSLVLMPPSIKQSLHFVSAPSSRRCVTGLFGCCALTSALRSW